MVSGKGFMYFPFTLGFKLIGVKKSMKIHVKIFFNRYNNCLDISDNHYSRCGAAGIVFKK
jgi:hypothetical protein